MSPTKISYVPTGSEMRIADRLLFLRYALPCAGTFVTRGRVTQEYVDNLITRVSEGRVPSEDVESMFMVANVMCTRIATRMHKKSIDSDVIREYFLFNHSKVVDDRFELMRDFNPIDCKTYAGTVTDVHEGYATVETALGRKKYRTVFERDIKPGENVVVHFDFIVETISEDTAGRMNAARATYEKRE